MSRGTVPSVWRDTLRRVPVVSRSWPRQSVALHSLAVHCLLLTALCSLSFAADERGIQIVPREQVRQERAKRWAVLIGVDKYEDETGIGSLKYCGQDMKLLYQVLTGPAGGFSPENVLLIVARTV